VPDESVGIKYSMRDVICEVNYFDF